MKRQVSGPTSALTGITAVALQVIGIWPTASTYHVSARQLRRRGGVTRATPFLNMVDRTAAIAHSYCLQRLTADHGYTCVSEPTLPGPLAPDEVTITLDQERAIVEDSSRRRAR